MKETNNTILSIFVDKKHLISLFLIITCVFFVYLPSLNFGFTNWDDEINLTQNLNVRELSLSGIHKIFTSTIQDVYIPLTVFSFALEYKFFKLNSHVYHFDNLLLHLIVTLLVYILIIQLGFSWLVAVLTALVFGIHPMHVESICWITERKDVLFATFYMLATCLYLDYKFTSKKIKYFLSILFGLCSVLSKPMALSLPLILILLDWYVDNKLSVTTIINKLLYFACIVPIAFLTYKLHARDPLGGNLLDSVVIWIWTFNFYIFKFFIPMKFTPLYAAPTPLNFYNIIHFLSVIFFVSFVFVLWRSRRKRAVVLSVFYFFFSIFFILRFDTKVDFTLVSDRFIYIPSIGLCLLFGLFIEFMYKKSNHINRFQLNAFLVLVIGLLIMQTRTMMPIWKDSLSLWSYIIKKDNNSAVAFNNRGKAYSDLKMTKEALMDYDKAIELNPFHWSAFNNRADIYLENNDYDGAVKDLSKSMLINNSFQSYYNRGNIYSKLGKFQLALSDYSSAINIKANRPEVFNNRGAVYLRVGDIESALNDFSNAINLDPDFADSVKNRAAIYMRKNNYDLALKDLEKLIDLKVADYAIFNNVANILSRKGSYQQALSYYDSSLKLNNSFVDGYYNRAQCYLKLQRYNEALSDLNSAIRLDHDHIKSKFSLGLIYVELKQFDSAIKEFSDIISIHPELSEVYQKRALCYRTIGDNDNYKKDLIILKTLGASIEE